MPTAKARKNVAPLLLLQVAGDALLVVCLAALLALAAACSGGDEAPAPARSG